MFHDSPLPANARLAVADSFRTRSSDDDGVVFTQVRGWEHHLHRFTRSVVEATSATEDAPTAAELATFLTTAAQVISSAGASFPRLELWHIATGASRWPLRLAMRPLPTLGESLHTALAAGVPVVHPRHKGPNIETFTRLNNALGREALLVTSDHRISEGATTSVLWWEDGTLCRSSDQQRVSSITELLVCEIAAEAGYPVASRTLTAASLSAHTAWGVNALHGIRPITHLDGEPLATPHRASLLREFRDALDQTWQTVR